MREIAATRELFSDLPLLLEAFPFPAWLSDPQGSVHTVNVQWTAYTGLAPRVSLGRGWLHAVAPHERLRTAGRFSGAYASGESDCFETRLLRADGEPRWNRARAIPLRDAAGQLVHWLATWSDFDEHVRTADRLRLAAAASAALVRSTGLEATFTALAAIIVPHLADWFVLQRAEPDGSLRVVFAHHRDPARGDAAAALCALRTERRAEVEATRARRPLLNPYTNVDALVAQLVPGAADEPVADAIRALGYRSAIMLPLVHLGEPVGTMLVVRSEADTGRYDARDVPLFGEIGAATAAAIAQGATYDALLSSYERERRIAIALQCDAMPQTLPDAFGLRIDGRYTPVRADAAIGGDWYDAVRLRDGRIVLSIGDVLGSGLDAATTMSNLRHILRGVAQVDPDPARLLEAADGTLRDDRPGAIVTAFVALYDPVTRSLRYAGAGHPRPLLRQPDGTLVELQSSGLPLGLREREEAAAAELAISPGALLVLFTDGLIESTRDLFEGERRLRAALSDPAICGAQSVAAALYDAVLFDGARDDVAILTVGFPLAEDARRVARWSFDTADTDAVAAARKGFGAFLIARATNRDRRFAAEVVLGELLSNAHRYAPGPVEVVVDGCGEATVLHVLDRGPGFRYRPTLPDAPFAERGRGLALVDALAVRCAVEPRPDGGSHVRVIL